MNAKTLAITIASLAVAVFVMFRSTAKASPFEPQHERFKLYQMEYNSSTDAAPLKKLGVFRLDTETGETFLYESGSDKNTNRWVKIDSK